MINVYYNYTLYDEHMLYLVNDFMYYYLSLLSSENKLVLFTPLCPPLPLISPLHPPSPACRCYSINKTFMF